jgi:hypothetical protein
MVNALALAHYWNSFKRILVRSPMEMHGACAKAIGVLGSGLWSTTIALHVFTRLPTKAQRREGGILKMVFTYSTYVLVCV